MCDGETQFHFNFVDRSFFVFCGSNHLRFEKTTTSAENCFLHTSLAADLPLNSIRNLCRGEFSDNPRELTQQQNQSKTLLVSTPYLLEPFCIFGLKGSRILDRFFFSLNSFLQEVPIADQEKFEKFEKM